MKYLVLYSFDFYAEWQHYPPESFMWDRIIAIDHPIYGIHYRKRHNPGKAYFNYIYAYFNEYGLPKYKFFIDDIIEHDLKII